MFLQEIRKRRPQESHTGVLPAGGVSELQTDLSSFAGRGKRRGWAMSLEYRRRLFGPLRRVASAVGVRVVSLSLDTPKTRAFQTLCKTKVDFPRFERKPRPGKAEFLAQGHIASK